MCIDDRKGNMLDSLDDQLCDTVALGHDEVVVGIRVDQKDLEFASVACVDEPWRVQAGDSVVERQSAPRLDEAGIAVGNCNRHARCHECPSSTRRNDDVVVRVEVCSAIAGVRIRRCDRIGVEQRDGYFEHPSRLPGLLAPFSRSLTSLRSVLAWIDLEMTGLEPSRHKIVEIASLVTNDDLEIIAEGPQLVIGASPAELAEMDDFVTAMHTSSGLLAEIETTSRSIADAQVETLTFLASHIAAAGTVPLAGNSIGTDRRFLAAQMPDIENFLHYRSVDVSTIKELARRWHPEVFSNAPEKGGNHRALDDIKESLNELRYYRTHLFAPPKA
jgi:oligoribonuclease